MNKIEKLIEEIRVLYEKVRGEDFEGSFMLQLIKVKVKRYHACLDHKEKKLTFLYMQGFLTRLQLQEKGLDKHYNLSLEKEKKKIERRVRKMIKAEKKK